MPDLRRLRLLEKAVKAVKPRHFDMAIWGEKLECGTACCAAGAYAMAYPKEGIRLDFGSDGKSVAELLFDGHPQPEDQFSMEPTYKLLASHFDLDLRDAVTLFSPAEYSENDSVGSSAKRKALAFVRRLIDSTRKERTACRTKSRPHRTRARPRRPKVSTGT